MGIISLKARNEFLERPRKNFHTYKQLSDDDLDQRVLNLPTKPPIYYKLTKLQRTCFLIGAETRRFSFFNDTGCLDGPTKIETDKGSIRIDELEKVGKPINVLSKTESGLRYVPASAPFKKGPADFYQVTFASGKKMVVTGKHRFLTQRGYISCVELKIGELLPIFDAGLLRSNSGFSPLKFPVSVPCSKRTPQGLMDHYYQYSRLCGEQPHLGKDSDRFRIQQFDEIVVRIPHSPLLFEHVDVLGILSTNTLLAPILSSTVYSDPCLFVSNGIRGPIYGPGYGQHLYQFCIGEPNQQASIPLGYIQPDLASEFFGSPPQDDHLYDNPSAFSSSSDCVTDISYIKTDYYYDLHVPKYENYISNGFCHHNTGKTLIAIALVRYFRKLGLLKQCLVLVPGRINKHELAYELKKHSPNSSYLILEGSSEDKWRALGESSALFVFETYAGLSWLVSDKKPTKKRNGDEVTKLTPNASKIKQLCKRFGGLVCDESVQVGNHQALPFRICRQLSKSAEMVITMTGTPFNRDPTLMWAQMYLADGGYTLGETLGLFRSIFCKEEVNYFSGFTEYKFDKKKKDLLNRFIANRSIAYEAEEGSKPGCIPIKKIVNLPEDAQAYYKRFRDELVAAKGNYQETKNAFIRMRQISSGFVGFTDDETGEKAKFEFPDNPKLDLLLSILQNLNPEHKSIVFFDFNYSGERILKELNKLKIPAVLLYGKTKDVDKTRQKFMDDLKTRVLLLQNRLGVGLNVQKAKYGIFFESPLSAIMRKQCEGRVHRQHSEHKTVFLYDLIMHDTVDESILKFHQEGKDLLQAIIRKEIQI